MKLKLLLLSFFIISPFIGFAQLAKYQTIFIFSFTHYVDWSSEYKDGDFVIGVLGYNEELNAELKDMASKRKVGNQTIKIQQFKNCKDVNKCHILYILKEKMGDFKTCIDKVKDFNTLIVTEASSFPEGAAINMVFDGTKLNFDVNVANAKSHGLIVSDKLVAVSKAGQSHK